MPASRLALLAPLLAGCVLYTGGGDDDPPPPPDAAWPWDPIDAPWGPPPDAWPNACYASSVDDCPFIGGAACFVYPQLLAWTASGTPPATTCSAPVPGVVEESVALGGVLSDLLTGGSRTGQVELLTDLTQPPVAVTATNFNGDWQLAVPAGLPDLVTLRTQAPGAIDVYAPGVVVTDEAIQPVRAVVVETSLLASMPALVGIDHTPGTSMVIVDARDCDGEPLVNVIVTLAQVPGASATCPDFVPWARVFYTNGGNGMPVRRQVRNSTDASGRAFIFEAPPSSAYGIQYVQVWGFTDQAVPDISYLTLLGEIPIHTFGDAITHVTITPAE